MKTAQARLLGGTGAVWVLLLGPVWRLGGAEAVVQSLAACLLCLLPAVLTLHWATGTAATKAEQRLLAAVFGGMLVRMAGVLAGGVALFWAIPALHSAAFWIWVLGFYLFTLTLETVLALTVGQKPCQPQG